MGRGVEVPLRRRDGSLRALALIDEVDAERVLGLRWSVGCGGYAARKTARPESRTMLMHRFVLGLADDDPAMPDHRNRNRLDNRRANLRIGTRALNQQNLPSMGGTSRFRGVSWDHVNARWRATVVLGGRQRSCGRHADEVAAALAVDAFRLEHMPFAEPDPALAYLDRGQWREC